MFVNVSPDPEDISQTKISLSFAEGVREVKFKKWLVVIFIYEYEDSN